MDVIGVAVVGEGECAVGSGEGVFIGGDIPVAEGVRGPDLRG